MKAGSEVTCAYPECGRPKSAKGLCRAHREQQRRGEALKPVKDYSRRGKTVGGPGTEEWFFARVDNAGDCWVWKGRLSEGGYGVFVREAVTVQAHRWAYEFLRIRIPDGLVIDHLCRNRACVNPWHMEPVTIKVNWSRGVAPSVSNARKTHCIHNHEFTPENTLIRREGGRKCRTCLKAYNDALVGRRPPRRKTGMASAA